METSDLMLGLSIGKEVVHAVEVDRGGTAPTVRALDEWENTLLAGDADPEGAGLRQFQEFLAAFMKMNRCRGRSVSVALDTSFLFLHTIPMEELAPKTELADQALWELQQYIPGTGPQDYLTAFHKIVRDPTERAPEYLCVSIKRNDSRTIRTALEGIGLNLSVLDVDHFSGDTALRINYPDSTRRHLALVSVKRHRLDISVLRSGNLESYRYVLPNSDREIVDHFGRLSREFHGMHSIVVYGPHLTNDLLVQIRHASAFLVEALNPLRHVNVSDRLRLSESIDSPSYRFASAIGVALRKD
jgi:Tfp pilus assembly PilM family ATPase